MPGLDHALSARDFLPWLNEHYPRPVETPQPPTPPSPPEISGSAAIPPKQHHVDRRGRPPKLAWDGIVRQHLFDLLDHHGWPSPDDPEWSNQAAVEKATTKFIEQKYGVGIVVESTIRDNIVPLMTEWKEKAEKADK
jgi:hypothetical protein